jgi:hypothetical protein
LTTAIAHGIFEPLWKPSDWRWNWVPAPRQCGQLAERFSPKEAGASLCSAKNLPMGGGEAETNIAVLGSPVATGRTGPDRKTFRQLWSRRFSSFK